MDTLTRRRFLIASGLVGGTGLAAGATTVGWDALRVAARDAGMLDGPPPARTLVLVTLYGGNDGLGTVVPAADPAYRRARPELAYAPEEVLDLGEGLGLNPSMTGLHGLWGEGRLAIVRGVGYPEPDRSHFRSMAIWQLGSTDASTRTGWLGRWLDGSDGGPLQAISIGPVLPPLLAGERTAGVAVPLDGLGLPPGVDASRLRAAGAPAGGEPDSYGQARAGMLDLADAHDALAGADTPPESGDTDDEARTSGASAGGQAALGRQLEMVGRCMRAGLPTRVYSVSLGGFDTHANEKQAQSTLLGDLDTAVTGFLRDVAAVPGGDGVVVMVHSEFGRRVAANAADGTDHGTAGPVLLAGPGVRGGFLGDQPSLTDLVDGDLAVTVDFRDVYASVLADVVGTDPERILGPTGRLPLFRP